MSSHAYRLGIVGVGKMGSALVKALLSREALQPEDVIAADISSQARDRLASDCPGVTVVDSVREATQDCEVLLIAVKPQYFESALSASVEALPQGQLIVSIMAGVPISRIAALLGQDKPIIRTMPNVCCEVVQGAFGYAANEVVSDQQKALVSGWFSAIGVAEDLKEELLDAVTGLSGSGPAFVAVFIEALADGGVASGLPRSVAQNLAAQTVLGAAEWVKHRGGPSALKDMVCSPAGTTIAGVRVLEAGGLRTAAIEAVVAATERSKQFGQ